MSIGKPIIGSISGETSQIISEAKCGFVSKAEDPIGLAKNIIKFIKLPKSKKQKLGYNSLIYSNKNFSKKKIFENLSHEIKNIQ